MSGLDCRACSLRLLVSWYPGTVAIACVQGEAQLLVGLIIANRGNAPCLFLAEIALIRREHHRTFVVLTVG